jgi:hypothetical protein
MKKYRSIIIGMLAIVMIMTGCASNNKEVTSEESEVTSSSKEVAIMTIDQVKELRSDLKEIKINDLSSDLSSDDKWFEEGGKMVFTKSEGKISTDSEEIAETWYKYKDTIPSDKDFIISAKVNVPKYWDTVKSKNGQVGVGIFLGKEGNGGKLVYEADLCTVANDQRFVQGQMIKNRLGGEPVEVDFKETDLETGKLEIIYKASEKTVSLVLADEVIGTQKIDQTGAVNWEMKEGDSFIVGIMGFSEWIKIESNSPSISEVTIAY